MSKRDQLPVFERGALLPLEELNTPDQSDIVVELIEDYLTHTPKRLEELKAAVTNQDVRHARYVAHGLKSSSAMLGLRRIEALARELDDESVELAAFVRLLPSLTGDFNEAKTALVPFLAERQSAVRD